MLEQRSLLSQFTRFTGATVASLMVFSLYSIVDGLFVAKGVGEFAMAAVNLAVPFTNILFSIAVVFAVGTNTIIAIYLGRGEGERADSLLSQNLALLTVIGVAISLLVLVFTVPFARLLGANETYHRLVCDYLFWYSLFAVPSGMMTFLNNYCRNDGSPVLVSVASIVSTVINIFLDWLFVFPLQKGLMGAAVATGISQTCGMLIVSSHFFLRRGRLRVVLRVF